MDPLLKRTKTVPFDADTGLSVPQIAVWMVFLTIFMDTLAATISTPVLPYYAREFGADNAAIGYLYAAWSFTSAFCAPMLGRLSDRIGRRQVLLMSLIGAGLANFLQAMATNYWMLLGSRAFSGVWAAVGSTAQVYLSDVASPAVLPDYMARLSSVPSVAMTFGPGLGGGLSTFGLNVPIFIDGALSFVAGVLVYFYLPESPVWEKAKGEQSEGSDAAPVAKTPVPRAVYTLALSGFFNGIVFGVNVSMLAISLNAKLGLNPLQIGYTFAACSIATLCSGIWITGPLQRRCGLMETLVLSTAVGGIGMIAMSLAPGLWPTLILLMISRICISIRMASSGTLNAGLTDATNRGAVFATLQMSANVGRMVAPIVAGHLATYDAIVGPWLLAGACSFISAAILPLVPSPKKPEAPKLAHGFSDLTGSNTRLEPEVGSSKDLEELGAYVAGLLTERRYRWISHRQAVYDMLDKLLPELSEFSLDHMEDLEKLMKHTQVIQKDFAQIRCRDG